MWNSDANYHGFGSGVQEMSFTAILISKLGGRCYTERNF